MPRIDPERNGSETRAQLEQHVTRVQRTIRTCAGCGMCCTVEYNAVQVLPVEGEKIAKHLRELERPRRTELFKRIHSAIRRHRLQDDAKPRRYTCAFLESDFRCALPLGVKPIACLSFNPVAVDACDQEATRYATAHADVVKANEARGLPAEYRPIPIAVTKALRTPAVAKGLRTPAVAKAPRAPTVAKAATPPTVAKAAPPPTVAAALVKAKRPPRA